MCMTVDPGFLLIGERPYSPDCFIITANATRTMTAMRRTICRRLAPREDDSSLWFRVVEAARVLRRLVEADPWYHSAGLIRCVYESPQLFEDPDKDERWNDFRAFLRMARYDTSARVRAYAQSLLIQMAFGDALDRTARRDPPCAR